MSKHSKKQCCTNRPLSDLLALIDIPSCYFEAKIEGFGQINKGSQWEHLNLTAISYQ